MMDNPCNGKVNTVNMIPNSVKILNLHLQPTLYIVLDTLNYHLKLNIYTFCDFL